METKNSDESNDQLPKRPKIESEGSTSSKPVAEDPFLTLPQDILVKIIGYTSIAQWPSLELLDTNFRAATFIAWRQLRSVDLERDFTMKPVKNGSTHLQLLLQKLVERSPFLTALTSVFAIPKQMNRFYDLVPSLAHFEHLQSIRLGKVKKLDRDGSPMWLEYLVVFLESTRSRASLKELHLYDIIIDGDEASTFNRFASSFVSGREIQSPLKLEKFSFSYCKRHLSTYLRLDTMDASRLIELNVGMVSIEPGQLSDLIVRASNLFRIELSFGNCDSFGCFGNMCRTDRHLEANKKLLTALATHEKLTEIKFDNLNGHDEGRCMDFKSEFIEMLKSIGHRGLLRKLAMEERFLYLPTVDKNEICSTIHNYIPYLQSIKLDIERISNESVINIVGLSDLEEIHFINTGGRMTEEAIKKIARLPTLKRLTIDGCNEVETDSLVQLAAAPALMDLRIRDAGLISADDFEKWSDGFASKLEVLMLFEIHDEKALIKVLKKAARLRVLILDGSKITDRSLTAIAESCPELVTLSVRSNWNQITVGHLQKIVCRHPELKKFPILSVFDEIAVLHLQKVVDRCPKLKELGGLRSEIWGKVRFPKYRKIGCVDMKSLEDNLDDGKYF